MAKVFCMSDVHGDIRMFDRAVQFMSDADANFLCFFLGDAADRGKHGYKIMKRLLGDTEHFRYIKGNHEDFFVKSARDILDDMKKLCVSPKEYLKDIDFDSISEAVSLHTCPQNGGAPTVKDWLRDGAPVDIVDEIAALPYFLSWESVDFCHAGCLREEWERNDGDAMLWSRYHFRERWFDDRVLIHGHTPVPSRWHNAGPIIYADDTKFDIDMGTPYTHNLCVVELCGYDDGNLSVAVNRFGKVCEKEAV